MHTDVVTAVAVVLMNFPVNHDCPDDAYVQKAFHIIMTILYSLKYDTVNRVHNLMRIIEDAPAYTMKYGEAFPISKPPKVFDDSINTKEAVDHLPSIHSRKQQILCDSLLPHLDLLPLEGEPRPFC